MNEKYLIIKMVKVNGVLNDGKPWKGVRAVIGSFDNRGNLIKLDICKATEDSFRLDKDLPDHPVMLLFNMRGQLCGWQD